MTQQERIKSCNANNDNTTSTKWVNDIQANKKVMVCTTLVFLAQRQARECSVRQIQRNMVQSKVNLQSILRRFLQFYQIKKTMTHPHKILESSSYLKLVTISHNLAQHYNQSHYIRNSNWTTKNHTRIQYQNNFMKIFLYLQLTLKIVKSNILQLKFH